MIGDISTWEQLLASGITATEQTLHLFAPYALIPNDGKYLSSVSAHVMFYGGPSVLQCELPAHRNTATRRLVVGEIIIPFAHLLQQRAEVVLGSAIVLGLADASVADVPNGRVRRYACIPVSQVRQLRICTTAPTPDIEEQPLEEFV